MLHLRARSERLFVALTGVINGHSQFPSDQISTRRLFWRSVKYNVNFAKLGKTFIPQQARISFEVSERYLKHKITGSAGKTLTVVWF